LKILVIGSGGREHALAWRLAQSPKVSRVFVAPGNAGTAREEGLYNLDLHSIAEWVKFAKADAIHTTVVGPETPLAAGVVDAFRAEGLRIFGPTKAAAQLEASKDFAKRFMGAPRHSDRALPVVLAGQGRARVRGPAGRAHRGQGGRARGGQGRGCRRERGGGARRDRHDARRQQAGRCRHRVVLEEFMEGEEASFIVMVDGRSVLPLASSQDHKRIFDGDRGPNTGGMGAYSPAPVVTPEVHHRAMSEIVMPVVKGMAAEGTPFSGFLYAGLMIDRAGAPRVVEFNCRLGDPEAQPILMRLKSDLLTLVDHAIDGKLDQVEAEWDRRAALGVVLAAAGYPETPRKGDEITGLPKASEDCRVFHAGTAMSGGRMVTSGGRVLCVTALGDKVKIAAERAYGVADGIRFAGMQYRRDIGARAVGRR
jgi:phosphoribosylamine---glycine ligase